MKTPEKLAEKVKLLKSGDNDAFTYVYEESYKYLYTCVIHIVKDEDTAQDMLQDTYVEVYKNISQLKEAEDFLSWAATIANRKCYAYIKKDRDILVEEQTDDEGNEEDFFESVADDESFIPENIFDNKEKIKMIRDIIDSLTDEQRACVIGFYYNDQKQDEIADQLGIPVNTVKSHLNRAKAKIKEAVSDIEKKQGVKLYSFSPFMLMLLSYEAKAFATNMAVPAASATLSATVAKGASTIATSAGKAAGKKTLTSSIKAASSALKAKIAVGAAATVIGVSAVVGIVNHNADNVTESKSENYIDTYIELDTLVSQVNICGKSLSDIDYEWFSANAPGFSTSNDKEWPHFIGDGLNMTWADYGFVVEEIGYGEDDISDKISKDNMKVEDVLDEFDPTIYDAMLKYGNVEFKNGNATFRIEEKGLREYFFTFDDTNRNGFKGLAIRAFSDGIITFYQFSGNGYNMEGKPLSEYSPELLDKLDEQNKEYHDSYTESGREAAKANMIKEPEIQEETEINENQQEESDIEAQSDIITDSFDVDTVIGKYANAKKITELEEIVASGTNIYSSSGKTMIVFYSDENGEFIGYQPMPVTEWTVGNSDVTRDSDGYVEATINSVDKWRMNVYECTDLDGDLCVDFYAYE
ncbi:MAG: sigma-70 family RNA polymerase sigma factor [Lachnospiraceae bacterium]|nr:sigma-70 family RNA polymerase sigma factor [Lachnospiraceae bacterium]